MEIEDQDGRKPIPDSGTTAVFCDTWKRKIFIRHMKRAGLEFTEIPKERNPVPKSAMWHVAYSSREHLNFIAGVIREANTEAFHKNQKNN